MFEADSEIVDYGKVVSIGIDAGSETINSGLKISGLD